MQEYSLTVGGTVRSIGPSALAELSIEALPDGSFHLLEAGKGYRCRVIAIDTTTREITVSVNGREHLVQVADRYDLIVRKLGFVTSEVNTSRHLHAPMPGLVLDILVEEGESIGAGTPLMILEAMKMENLLKADGEGVVKKIRVDKGVAVDKRQLLIEIE